MGSLQQVTCGNYEKVHYDTKSDLVVLKVGSQENTYTRAIQGKWLSDKVALGKVRDKENQTPSRGSSTGRILEDRPTLLRRR